MILYSRDARDDVERLHDWLHGHSARSAEIFMDRLMRAEQRIESRPRAYRMLQDGASRRCGFRLNRTTYLVDYRIEREGIVVLRVWHGRQDRPA